MVLILRKRKSITVKTRINLQSPEQLSKLKIITYIVSIDFKKGKTLCNTFRLASPCTKTTGMRKRIVRIKVATITTNFEIHVLINVSEKKGQYTSSASGASSVTQCVGLIDCWMWRATAVP